MWKCGKDSCYNCENAGFFSDESVGISIHMDSCAAADSDITPGREPVGFPSHIGERYEWREEIMPLFCGNYKPILAEKCSICGTDIMVPAHRWPLWVPEFYSGELYPVCSHTCHAEGKANEDKLWAAYEVEQQQAEEFWRKRRAVNGV